MLEQAFASDMPRLPRVLVVSDVLLYREGVARGLAQGGTLSVVGAAGGRDALALMATLGADAILLDASAPDALAVAHLLRAQWPGIPLIGFGIGDDDSSLACVEAGLTGFVDRDGTLAELTATIERALAGEVRCSPRLAALLCERVASLSVGGNATVAGLTRREREIAELVAQGLSNKEIAIELRIGPATVKNHIHNILEKLRVPRRAAIAGQLRPRSATGPAAVRA